MNPIFSYRFTFTLCLFLLSNIATGQIEVPNNVLAENSLTYVDAEHELDEEPTVYYDLITVVEKGIHDYTWLMTKGGLFSQWSMYSNEKVYSSGKIYKIEHIKSWCDGFYIGSYKEPAAVGFGTVTPAAFTKQITVAGRLEVADIAGLGRTYTKSHNFTTITPTP